MNDLWIRETLELISDWEKEHQNLSAKIEALEEKIEELDEERGHLEEKMITAQALIQAYKEKHNIAVFSSLSNISNVLANKSYPEMLVEIAEKAGGYLRVSEAVDFMLHSRVSDDRRAIQANIYSALRRSNRFKKMKPGEYRFVNHIRKEDDGKPSGVRQAVKEVKGKNPQWTKREVLNHLLKTGFDFKGKKPANAVNMSWAYLGYAEDGKQPTLIGVDAHRIAMLRDKQRIKTRGRL